jgi:hypothetical protein
VNKTFAVEELPRLRCEVALAHWQAAQKSVQELGGKLLSALSAATGLAPDVLGKARIQVTQDAIVVEGLPDEEGK